MICVSPLGFDPYFRGKLLPPQHEFIPSINSKQIFLQKLWTNFEKSKNAIFLKTAQPIFMVKIYVIEGIKLVIQKIQESIPLIRRGERKIM